MTDESLILSSIGTGRNGARQVGSMLGYKPVPHGNFPDAVLPIEIPFTRASTGMEFVNGLWQSAAINMPRRYNDSYLNEPAATNSLLRSNTLSDAVWQKQAGVSVAASASLSPDGTLDAWTITYPAIDSRQVFQALSLGSATYTVSIWAKSATGRTFRLKVYNGSADTFSADFTTTSSWQLFQYTFTSAIVNVGIVNGTAGLAGDLDVWNCQEEVGSVATSPIITAGSAVTRAADNVNKTGASDPIGQTEGTIFVDVVINSENNPSANIINGAKNTNSSFVILRVKATKAIRAFIYNSTALKADITGGSYNLGDRLKIAYAYKSGDSALYVNGTQLGTSADTISFPATLSELNWDDATTYFGYQEAENINESRISKTRLPNAELAALTT